MQRGQRSRSVWPGVTAAVAAVAGLVLFAGVGVSASRPGDSARAGGSSSSTGVRLEIVDVPAIGQGGFSGKWGTASTGAAGGRDQANYADDPDGVQDYVSIANPSGSTSGDVAVDAWDATSDPNVLDMRLRSGGPSVLNIATLHTYARCQPPHAPQVQNYVTAPTVAGRPIAEGTTRISATGAQLGYPSVATAELTVTMKQIQETTPNVAAEARVEITIAGDLKDGGGNRIYSGPLANVVLGDVRAHCDEPSPTPTPTPPGRLVVDKRANKKVVKVGGKVRYTLRATNVGGTTLDPATFTDDLSDILRHGRYDHNARATSGKVTYRRPLLTWTGRLAPGRSVIVTYTVTAYRVGIMRNVVVWPLPRPTPTPKPPKPRPKPSGKDVNKVWVVPKNVK